MGMSIAQRIFLCDRTNGSLDVHPRIVAVGAISAITFTNVL